MKYCLQLNIYKRILQRRYGTNVFAMFVVCLHPDLATPWVYPVPNMEGEVEPVMFLRRRDGWAKKQMRGWAMLWAEVHLVKKGFWLHSNFS